MNGIEKYVDSLGRVVIPMKFREKLGIESNSKILISLENGIILMTPAIKHCALCNKRINDKTNFRLCEECISEIRKEK